MKKEDLFETLGDIDPESVEKAGHYRSKKKKTAWGILVACAAAAIIAAVVGVLLMRNSGNTEEGSSTAKSNGKVEADVVKLMASYPASPGKNMDLQTYLNGEESERWFSEQLSKIQATSDLASSMDGYYAAMMNRLLADKDGNGENTVCSPLNTYVAFAMLAEVSSGNSQKQVLDMLGVSDMESLRKNVKALWESNYADTPMLKSMLGNSLWLNNTVKYNEDTLKRLTDQYYASSFRGDPASEEMSRELRNWIDDNTGKMLTEYTKDISMDPETVMELVSTIYFKAQWQTEFNQERTTKETFHGLKGDQTVDMMHMEGQQSVYRTDKYTEVSLSLKDSGAMHFYLPKEGTNVDELLKDTDILKAVRDQENSTYPHVKLSVPKFNVSGKKDLRDTMKDLGVTDVLDASSADFSALTEEKKELFISKVDHAAVVEIDEQGVSGAAYVDMAICGSGMPNENLEITLDRPFLFVVTGWDGAVLFSGVVRNIG